MRFTTRIPWEGIGLLVALLLLTPSREAIPWPDQEATPGPSRSASRIRLVGVIDQLGGKASRGLLGLLTGTQTDKALLSRPYGVAWLQESLLVTDPGTGSVLKITARGRIQKINRQDFSSPVGIATCNSEILVTDSRLGTVEILDTSLKKLGTLLSDLRRPTGVVCRGGSVWISETGRHELLEVKLPPGATRAGVSDAIIKRLGGRGAAAGEFNFPTSLAITGNTLWISDTLNFRIQSLDLETGVFGTPFGTLGDASGEMPRIKGLAVDSTGVLWVSDAYLNEIALFDARGVLLSTLGGPGREPGRFDFPAGIASSSKGEVVVVDSLNQRLQLFRAESPAEN